MSPVSWQGVVEGPGDVDGLLAQGAVGDEKDLVRLHPGAEPLDLGDQVRVDLEPAGGVEEDRVGPGGAAARAAPPIAATSRDARSQKKAQLLLPGEDFELVDGGRPVDVGGDEERPVPALLEEPAELGGRGRLARAVEPDHEDLERAGRAQARGALAEELHELVVDDLDDLLARGDALEDLLAGALGLDPVDEVAGDLEIDVGGQERGPHLLEGVGDILFGQLPDAPQIAQRLAEPFGQRFEHGSADSLAPRPGLSIPGWLRRPWRPR